MNSFASDINQLLKRLIDGTATDLSESDKALLSHLHIALANLLKAQSGLEAVYKVSFQESGHLLRQQDAGMEPSTPTNIKADFQVKASGLILNFLNILCLDNVNRYLSDRFDKITRVEAGHVVNSMKKDEHLRETKKRKKGGQKSHERMKLVKSQILDLALTFLNAQQPKSSSDSFTLKEVNAAIHDDVVNFFKEHPDLPQSKKIISNSSTPPDLTSTISEKLSDLKKEGLLRPFFEPSKPNQ